MTYDLRVLRVVAVTALVVLGVAAADAGAAPDANLRIRPGVSVGKVRLGMTERQVRAALGRPRLVVRRSAAFGVRALDYEYGLGAYTVRFVGPRGRLKVVRVGTTLVRERTPQGVGVGSLERAVVRAYPSMRCQPLQTELRGSIRLVRTIQRTCTLFAPSGRRTIFASDVYERMFEVITPQVWARRARVVEVSVATPA